MHRTRIAVALLGVTLAAVSGSIAGGEDRTGTCVTAEIPQTIVLPDGREMPGGAVRLCFSRRFSPVSGLHAATIAGKAAGMFASERRISEGLGTHGDAFVVLRRVDDRTLALVAYAVRAGDRLVTYRLRDPRGARAARTAGSSPDPGLADLLAGRDDGVVFVAAR